MTTTDTRELEQVLVRTVRQLGEVQASALRAKLPKPFQRPTAELTTTLEALANRGEVFRHPTAKTKFLAFDPGAAVQGLLLESLGSKAMTEAALKQQVAKKGASMGLAKAVGPLTSAALKSLVGSGVAFVHRSPPPPGESKRPAPKTLRYASEPQPAVALRPYVKQVARELRALVKNLTPFGATVAEAFKAFALELGVTLPGATTDGRVAPPALPNGNGSMTPPPNGIEIGAHSSATPVPLLAPVGGDGVRSQPAIAGGGAAATPVSANVPHHKGNGTSANGGPDAIVAVDQNNGVGGGAGVDPSNVSPLDDTERLLRALDEVAAREPEGSLLSIARVREIAGLDKEVFDRITLKLARAQQVVLHFHDYPASLTPERRAQLVVDEENTHYVGIVRWSKE